MVRATGSSAESTIAVTAWGAFRHPVFTILWIATVVSNIGSWMQSAASGWLMTTLSPSPYEVALVQAAGSLPMFLFSLPAGALADIVDRRWLLIWMQIVAGALSAAFAVMIAVGTISSDLLLTFIFLSGITAILSAPAWQAIVPQLVPRHDMPGAIALNGAGFNLSRAVGPALAGIAIAALGMASPFFINAASNLVAIGALLWWRSKPSPRDLPVEHFFGAMRAGLRYAAFNRPLQATLVRSAAFFPLASVYWALLPLLARNQIGGGPAIYGFLLGAIGVGAVAAAFVLPAAKARLGADGTMHAATALTAVALVLFAIGHDLSTALVACALAGIAWIAAIATLTVSAQFALPAWVRGRGLAIFACVQFAGLAAGSVIWGKIAAATGLPTAHVAAAIALVVLVPALSRWHLETGAGNDLTPSMHWPTPVLSHDPTSDRGPVLVTVDYVVAPGVRTAFLAAIRKVGEERRRDGAYAWGIYQDLSREDAFVETFQVASWLEHMRQHERVTNADKVVEDAMQRLLAAGTPLIRHLITPSANELP